MNDIGSKSVSVSGNEAKIPETLNTSDKKFNNPLGYLRAFIIVLVLAHHAALPYHPILPASPASSMAEYMHSIRAISPVNDEQRSTVFFLLTFFNDNFFMALMFFLSGLFVWKSLLDKGRFNYLRDRLIRLGLPFTVMAFLAPLTYYTTYLQTGGNTGLAGFWQQWTSIGNWPTGPAWFIWFLLAFDIIAVLLSTLISGKNNFFKKIPPEILRRPAIFFSILVLISAIAYIPMALNFDPNFNWWTLGPFSIQTSRVFLYAVYFLAGVVLGAYGIERTLLVKDGALARRWIIWVIASLAAFLINVVLTFSGASQLLISISLILSCAASSFAFLAIFLRFATRRRKIFDSLFANGYGIFVIHYVIVSWLQYSILKMPLPAIAKGSIVFACGLALCLGAIAVVRRIPAIARVI